MKLKKEYHISTVIKSSTIVIPHPEGIYLVLFPFSSILTIKREKI